MNNGGREVQSQSREGRYRFKGELLLQLAKK